MKVATPLIMFAVAPAVTVAPVPVVDEAVIVAVIVPVEIVVIAFPLESSSVTAGAGESAEPEAAEVAPTVVIPSLLAKPTVTANEAEVTPVKPVLANARV